MDDLRRKINKVLFDLMVAAGMLFAIAILVAGAFAIPMTVFKGVINLACT